MKKTTTIFYTATFMALILQLISCTNTFTKDETTASTLSTSAVTTATHTKGTLSLAIQSIARTVQPSALTTSDLSSFILYGTFAGGTQVEIASWDTYAAMQSDNTLTVD